MKAKQNAWMVFFALCLFLISGCGDTYRPVANPIASANNPIPQPYGTMVVVSNGGSNTTLNGESTEINVSGDSIVQQVSVGLNPVSAFVSSSGVYTANQANDSVSYYSPIATAPPVTTITLASGSAPVYAVQAGSNIYVANSGSTHQSVGVVGFPSGSSVYALLQEIPLDSNPTILAALPNGSKVYSVNSSTNDINVISTKDNTVTSTIALASGSNPVWAVASSDNLHVFVVNQGSNNVSVIDATTDRVVNTVSVGSAPNRAIFDPMLIRVYVTNTQSNNISAINADPNSSSFLAVKNIGVGKAPVSVTALADGSRVYVANSGSNDVWVIDPMSYTVTNKIPVGTGPAWIASSADSSKVYVADQGSLDVAIIRTSNNTEIFPRTLNGTPSRLQIQQDPNCVPTPQQSCPMSVPIFVSSL